MHLQLQKLHNEWKSIQGKSYIFSGIQTTIFKAGCCYLIWLPNDKIDDLKFLKAVISARRQQLEKGSGTKMPSNAGIS